MWRPNPHKDADMKTVLTALLLASPIAASADTPFLDNAAAFIGGNQLNEDCTSASRFDQGFCAGYIIAVADMAQGLKSIDVCLPKDVVIQQAVDVIKKYLADNPAARHYSAYTIVIAALNAAFPCPKAPPAAAPSLPR
jgi:hypothetical protein